MSEDKKTKIEISEETRQKLFRRWDGRCAFCGMGLTVEDHHIVARKDDPSLIDDLDNLILLCGNHHSLTRKKKPDGSFSLTISDIEDLQKSKYCYAEKMGGFYFNIPQKFAVKLGSNICYACPHVLVIDDKPIIEIWPQSSVWYEKTQNYYLYARFFDEENNFIGGMFANSWASVDNDDWEINLTTEEVLIKNRSKPLFIKFSKTKNAIMITGQLFYNKIGLQIDSKQITYGTMVIRNSSSGYQKVGFGFSKNCFYIG